MSKPTVYLTRETVQRLLEAAGQGAREVRVSLDLNLHQVSLRVSEDRVDLPGIGSVSLRKLWEETREGLVYRWEEGSLSPLERRGVHYYKLMPTREAPTLVIDGIQMHQTRRRLPFEEAKDKARQVVRSGDVVLDTCGGLGYTALWAARLGASRVACFEVDPQVLALRGFNPWILEMAQDARIAVIEKDVRQGILDLEDDAFDAVIHDPPRLALAGDLYGSRFYEQIHRILRPRGKLFHYVGNPGGRYRHRNIPAGVTRRLVEVGFRVEPRERLLGLVAWKVR